MKEIILTLSEYNKDTNNEIFAILNNVSINSLNPNIGSYFNSITGILNHVLVTNIWWLQRLAKFSKNYKNIKNKIFEKYQINSINQIITENYKELKELITKVDYIFINLVKGLEDSELKIKVNYINSKKVKITKEFGFLLLHIFNHHTHHRGQLSQILDSLKIDNDFSNLNRKYDGF